MRGGKLMVAFAATIPPTQVAAKRRNIATETGINEADIIVIDGATSLTLLPPEPDGHLTDLIRQVLEANRTRLQRGLLDDVAAAIVRAFDKHQTT